MIGTLRAVALDAPDARRLAAFHTALAGCTERAADDEDADDEWVTLETGDGWRVAAQRSPGHVPPRWPDPAGKPTCPCLDKASRCAARRRERAAARAAHPPRPRHPSH